MKSVLVTGGLGYIGSHLSLRLLEEGYKVFVIDSLVNSSYETLNKINSIISLEKKIQSFILKHAAKASVRLS